MSKYVNLSASQYSNTSNISSLLLLSSTTLVSSASSGREIVSISSFISVKTSLVFASL